jgi:hypothetical protein
VRDALEYALPWARRLTRLAAPFKGGSDRGRPRKGVARLGVLVRALSVVLRKP